MPVLATQARRSPGNIAIRHGSTAMNYATLDVATNRLANWLRATGVGRGDLVALVLPRGIGAVVAVLGVLKAGAAYLPIDPTYPAERISFVIRDSGARLTLTEAALACLLPPDATHCRLDSEAAAIATQSPHAPALDATPDDRIYVIYTSGSTGQPKGAGVTHRSFANLLQWYVATLGLGAADGTLLISALGFDLTQKNLFAPLLVGGTLNLPVEHGFDPAAIVATIEAAGVAWVNCTPSTFLPLIEGAAAERPERLSSLRWAVLGGEPIPAARMRRWLRHPACNARVLNTYGPTECTDICAAWAFDGDTAEDPVPLGGPIDNVALAVLDEHRQPVQGDAEGELWIAGAGVGLGYLGRPELEAERFLPLGAAGQGRKYRTGDRVKWRPDGALDFLGRVDHQVKLRGHRIELGEIEARLAAHPALLEAVVALRQDDPGGPYLIAYAVLRPGLAWPGEAALRSHLATALPPAMVPARYMQLPGLPLSPNGKVDRHALPAPDARLKPVAAPADEVEQVLAEIWGKALGQVPDGLHSNFFDLGGTSLALAEVQAEVQRRFGRDVPIIALFAHPTIAAQARHLRTTDTVQAPAAAVQGLRQAAALRRMASSRGAGR